MQADAAGVEHHDAVGERDRLVDVAIDLPAPRSHRQPQFLAYREQLLRALGVAQKED